MAEIFAREWDDKMLLQKRKKKRTIVFVCTGNTCRSPMAQGLLEDWLTKNNMKTVEVKTAGVMTIAGLLPTPEAVQVMESAEIDVRKHRSAPLTPEMLRKADLVLGMTPFHVQFALRMLPEARDKTFLLKEYTKSDLKNYQITDPMGATLEVYKRVFREIKLAVDRLVEMDAVLAPLDQDLKHEKYVPPKPVKEPKAASPTAKAGAAPSKAEKPRKAAPKKKAASPAPKKPAAKAAPAKKAKPAEKKATPAAESLKPAAKKAAPKAAAAKAAPKKKPSGGRKTAKK